MDGIFCREEPPMMRRKVSRLSQGLEVNLQFFLDYAGLTIFGSALNSRVFKNLVRPKRAHMPARR